MNTAQGGIVQLGTGAPCGTSWLLYRAVQGADEVLVFSLLFALRKA